MAMDPAKLTVDQLTRFAQAEKQNGERARTGLAKVHKSAEDLVKAARVVADISKKNPEL